MSNAPTPPADIRPYRPSPAVLVFAPVPGLGHWLVRRGGRGLLVFMAFTFGLNLVLLSAILKPVARLAPTFGWLLAGAAVLFSLVDVTRIVLKGRQSPTAPASAARASSHPRP